MLVTKPAFKDMKYQEFLNHLGHSWHQGQHLTVMGPTGCGKTWLCADILQRRKYVALLCTKGRDETIKRYKDWRILDQWKDRYYRDNHVIVWPKARTLDEAKFNVRPIIRDTLENIYIEGGWTLGLDDLKYLCEGLSLKTDLSVMYGQVRSNGTSLVGCGQRPFGIIQPALDQASHWLLFFQADSRDTDRMAEVSGLSRRMCADANCALIGRDFIWLRPMGEPVIVRR